MRACESARHGEFVAIDRARAACQIPVAREGRGLGMDLTFVMQRQNLYSTCCNPTSLSSPSGLPQGEWFCCQVGQDTVGGNRGWGRMCVMLARCDRTLTARCAGALARAAFVDVCACVLCGVPPLSTPDIASLHLCLCVSSNSPRPGVRPRLHAHCSPRAVVFSSAKRAPG